MKENSIEKEINLRDMILEWFLHWRSMVIVLIFGVAVAVALGYAKKEAESVVSDTDKESVERYLRFAELYDYWVSNYSIEKFDNVNESNDYISSLLDLKKNMDDDKNRLTPVQKLYLESVETGKPIEQPHSSKISKKGIVIGAILALFIHFLICICGYVFSHKVKGVDDTIDKRLGVKLFFRIIDWKSIDKKCLLDRKLWRRRFCFECPTAYDEQQAIFAEIINNELATQNEEKVLFINLCDSNPHLTIVDALNKGGLMAETCGSAWNDLNADVLLKKYCSVVIVFDSKGIEENILFREVNLLKTLKKNILLLQYVSI